MYYVQHKINKDKIELSLSETKLPEITSGQLLIKVTASGINRPDILQRQGLYPPPPQANPVLGLEIAGHIEKIGAGTQGFHIGQRVCALTSGGGYAEFCAVSAKHCFPVPDTLTDPEAACLPEGLFTLWSLLWHQGQLKPKDRILLHGGNSGIATLGSQLLIALGHDVCVSLRSPQHLEKCQLLQLKKILIVEDDQFLPLLKQIYADGVDLILDLNGGPYLQQNIQALALEGRLILMGFMGSAKADINLTRLLTHRLTLTGATLRPRTEQTKDLFAQAIFQQLFPVIKHHNIKPVVDRTWPISQANLAHQYM